MKKGGAAQAAAERVFSEALKRVSRSELLAMREHLERAERAGRKDWSEEDEPFMRRLLGLVEEVRCEEAEDFPWRSEMEGERSRSVTTSRQTRVRRLEEATDGGGECPRCSGTTVIYLNGKLHSVTKEGRKLTPGEAQAFGAEEEDGRCPVCGVSRGPEIVIGLGGSV